jgi:dCMP deaminase
MNTINCGAVSDSQVEWDQTWIGMAEFIANRKSKDRSTKVGAVIVAGDQAVLSLGWNGFPRGVDDKVEARHERPAKYQWTEHAERNAIYNAVRRGVPLLGSTIYVTHFPCCDCARGIAQSGVTEIVTREPDWGNVHLQNTQYPEVSVSILCEAGVQVRFCR